MYAVKLTDAKGHITYVTEDAEVKVFVSFYDCQRLIAEKEKQGMKGEIIIRQPVKNKML